MGITCRGLYVELCAVIPFSLAVMYIKKNNYKIITIQCTKVIIIQLHFAEYK